MMNSMNVKKSEAFDPLGWVVSFPRWTTIKSTAHACWRSLLTATGPLPGRAIGAATQHAYHYLQGAVLEGVHGVLFQRKFFDNWASNYEGCWASTPLSTLNTLHI